MVVPLPSKRPPSLALGRPPPRQGRAGATSSCREAQRAGRSKRPPTGSHETVVFLLCRAAVACACVSSRPHDGHKNRCVFRRQSSGTRRPARHRTPSCCRSRLTPTPAVAVASMKGIFRANKPRTAPSVRVSARSCFSCLPLYGRSAAALTSIYLPWKRRVVSVTRHQWARDLQVVLLSLKCFQTET